MAVLVETTAGDFVVDLYVEERPKTCLNFVKLCKMKYYNYCLFHNVERNFIAQTGDPKSNGGESIWGLIKGEDYKFFESEMIPRIKHTKAGIVSMVNNGKDYNASQFYITLREDIDYLDGKHTIFGELAESEGLDVVQKLDEAYCNKEGRPLQDIRILHTVVLDDPFDDPEGFEPPSRSPSPPPITTDAGHIGAEEDINDFDGKTEREVQELMESRESKANANILEMVGDIPDADARPPENVLFVCKLNPATTAEDLEIIFSRFGAIVSCEVIKDLKSGDSLQYAFIEFENEEDCTNAYFKMDNVLIDDRRIHVDFSQSLAKVKPTKRRLVSEGSVDIPQSKGRGGEYDMVFDDEALLQEGSRGKQKRRKHSRSPERKHSKSPGRTHRGGDGNRDGRDHQRHRSRSGERRRRNSRERKRQSSNSREKRRQRSTSRERRRQRSNSRERRRQRSNSREGRREERRRYRSRSRSREDRRHRRY